MRAQAALGPLGLALRSRLPTIVPDLARPHGRAMQLESAHAALSAAQSRAVLKGVQGAILAARDHIHLETYILDDDDVGRRFAEALIAKQRQGVQVNLIRDSVGTVGTPKDFFQCLTDSGIRILEFNPMNPALAREEWELNHRDHRKLLFVDGRIAFLGGINISSVYSGGSFGQGMRARPAGSPSWRDTDLQLQGPVVAELQELFLATWVAQKGVPLTAKNFFPKPESPGRQLVRAIGSSPDDPYSLIYATPLSAIASAETSVHLTNAYFAPDPQLLAALDAAAARGVDLTLILPSNTDSWLVFHAGRGYYEQLLRAGVKIHERRDVILHSKTALIDGVWATVGSTNLDWRSFLHHHELNAVVLGVEFGHQVHLKPQEEIGAEVHKLDQFFRVEAGSGEAVLDGVRTPIRTGFSVLVPAGAKHNIIYTGAESMKLYTLYAPPNHRDGVVHHTRADAEADSEHFDGKTPE